MTRKACLHRNSVVTASAVDLEMYGPAVAIGWPRRQEVKDRKVSQGRIESPISMLTAHLVMCVHLERVLFGMAAGAHAQSTLGSIRGIVQDGSGAVIPGARSHCIAPTKIPIVQ
jgi:hypothetical protein